MPFPDCSGCLGGSATLDALTSTSSHELCEAITDPVPGQGWYDDANGEIGDICAWQTRKLAGWTVQLEWSNRLNNWASEPSPRSDPGNPPNAVTKITLSTKWGGQGGEGLEARNAWRVVIGSRTSHPPPQKWGGLRRTHPTRRISPTRRRRRGWWRWRAPG